MQEVWVCYSSRDVIFAELNVIFGMALYSSYFLKQYHQRIALFQF